MGLAAGVGLIVASTVSGGKFSKAVPNILAAIVGGILGGLILSFFL
jgi:outer membrane lipoprotein SlyB